MKLSDAQFRRRTFYVPNSTATWIDPNDVSSTVDSDVELNSSNSIHSYAVKKWSTMFSSEKKIVIYALTSAREKFDVSETRSLHGRNSHVGHSKLIHWSTQIRYVGLK